MLNRLAALGLCGLLLHGPAQSQALAVPAGMRAEGLPALSARPEPLLQQYQDLTPHSFVAWHPARLEMLVLAPHGDVRQLHRLSQPMGRMEPLTEGADPVASASYEPQRGSFIVFTRDQGGDEAYQLFRLDPDSRRTEPLSERGRKVGDYRMSPDGRWLAYTSLSLDASNTEAEGGARHANVELRLLNPLDSQSQRLLLKVEKERLSGLQFSPDGKSLLFIHSEGGSSSGGWRVDLGNGRLSRLVAAAAADDAAEQDRPEAFDNQLWSSAPGVEFQQLQVFNLVSGEKRRFELGQPYDVEAVASPRHPEQPVATLINQGGISRLRLFDPQRSSFLPTLKLDLPAGIMSNPQWHAQRSLLAFTHSSARSPGEVIVYNHTERNFVAWTGRRSRISSHGPAEPSLIRWASFDGREISGFYYPAGPHFPGKRPVIISLHGGPAAQSRPGFLGRMNAYPAQMGVALIYPNVRGSSGYGRSFQDLDNGRKREDAIKDVGALLDWIALQPELDASRVLVQGGSYGGYMALAVATLYSERIAGSIARVGMSNLVSFLEHTESYRRDNRRLEYGDERIPEMRQFQQNISPLTRADRIRKPLMIVHGMNDPRVPYNEAVQMVQAVRRNGTPVWFLAAEDEGHGFKKSVNATFLFRATLEFTKQVLSLP
ncbi:MAG: S9 family peptidase [Burkholderiaceae bacterium]|nr:S9 family peptidase [Burkholderiaceae bacterium]MBT9504266.1 S9 family peptidase [Burkholderiaceae bacterium]